MGVITSSFGFMYYPLTARLDADGEHGEINRMYKLTAKWGFVVSFPAALCLIVFPDDILLAVFNDYARGSVALAILVISSFINVLYGRCQDTLSAFGYTTLILKINAATLVLNVILNATLIPPFGVDGAAVASAISFISLNTLAFAVLWRRSGIQPFSRWTVKTFVVLPAVLFPASIALSQFVRLSVLTIVPFLLLAGLASIALLAVTGSLQPEDKIPINLIENRLGIRIPIIQRYIPERHEE